MIFLGDLVKSGTSPDITLEPQELHTYIIHGAFKLSTEQSKTNILYSESSIWKQLNMVL